MGATMNIKGITLKGLAGLALCICTALSATLAGATEGGSGAYPNGAEGVMAGALPPPGFYYLNYLTHYSADRLNDKGGHRVPVDFNLNATANVSRFLYMTDGQVAGGNLGFYGIAPLVHLSGTLSPAPGVTIAGTKSGLGDITVGSVLAWHTRNFHYGVAVDVVAPTGDYNKNETFNIGRNYWTFEPIIGATLLTDHGIELSAKLMYDINTKNSDTDYKSGHELHADYAAAYHMGPWTLGATGYFYKQVTDDKQNSATVAPDGNKGQVLAVGPAIKYDYKNLSLEAKHQKEMLAENRAEGDKYWVKLIWGF